MWFRRLTYFGILTGVLVFHAYYTVWISRYAVLIVLALPVFSLLCSLPGMLRLRISLGCPERCLRGNTALLHVRLRCGGLLPAPPCRLRLRTEDAVAGKKTERRLDLFRSCSSQMDSSSCGARTVSVLSCRVYDHLGLIGIPIRKPEPVTLLVCPEPVAPDPLPDLRQLEAQRFRPKPGGGYSEFHELREYRPGDPIRTIHWKLSAKADKLIVREAEEPISSRVLVLFDFPQDRDAYDLRLSRLRWLSSALLRCGAKHTVCALLPDGAGLSGFEIREEADVTAMLDRFLRVKLSQETATLEAAGLPQADWLFCLGGEA